MHVMHLEVQVKDLGRLELAATADVHADENITSVAFVLVCSPGSPLSEYFFSRYVDEHFLSYSIVEQGRHFPDWEAFGQHLFMFHREIEGELRDPRGYLFATANKLRKELVYVANFQQSMLELDDQINWSETHGSDGHSMPDYSRPRFVDEKIVEPEFDGRFGRTND